MEISPRTARHGKPHKCKKCKKWIDAQDLCVEMSDGIKYRWCKYCGHREIIQEDPFDYTNISAIESNLRKLAREHPRPCGCY